MGMVKYMNTRIVIVCLSLLLVGVALITSSSGAKDSDFPNLSTSSTFIYSLDVDGNCEVYTINRFENIDKDYNWTQKYGLGIPIAASSFLDEQPNVTMATLGDIDVYYDVYDYINVIQPDQSYIHRYKISLYPPSTYYFHKKYTITIRTKSIINESSSRVHDYYKFTIPKHQIQKDSPPFKYHKDFVIKVNLPNDPYYWSEVLDTIPKYDYRTSFGRGKSLEWWYKETDSVTGTIFIDYRIHPDPLKQELDNISRQSRDISERSLHISYIALFITFALGITAVREDLKKSVQALQNHIHSTIDKRKNRRKNKK